MEKKGYICNRYKILCNLEDVIMLGVNSPREPITPEFSRKIRAALWRATTGNLTPEEKDAIRRGREARKRWKIVWEDK